MSREKVKGLIKKFGYNSSSYHLLKDDKKYFFSENFEGVIGFVEFDSVVLAAGDAVCSDSDVINFVFEFRKFCQKKGKDCCFQAVTKKFKDVLDLMGFGFVKIGEEPFFDFSVWNIVGKDFVSLRNALNKAKRNGFIVKEYNPLLQRNVKYEEQMILLSKQWLKEKRTGEFSFLVGSPSLDDPLDRKYFLVLNSVDGVEAFLVCVPIFARNGIYFDIMRRKQKPEKGTTELLITESFKLLREQGFLIASLGSAPLADITKDSEKKQLIQHAFSFVYNNLNYFYRFKPLFSYKQQFNPTFWESKYLAFYPPIFKPKYVYAVLKAYDPIAVPKMLLPDIKKFWKKIIKIK